MVTRVKIQKKKSGTTYSYVMTLPKKLLDAIGWTDVQTVEIRLDYRDGKPVLIVSPSPG